MFVVILSYTAPLDRVDELLPQHVAWLAKHFATGDFLAAGRRVPRSGGVIIATAVSRTELDATLAEDPFRTAGIADYQVVEFEATRTAPALDAYRAG